MMQQNLRITIVGFFLIVIGTCKVTAQSGTSKRFSYVDVYGNTISVNNIKILPKAFDTSVIKTQLTGKNFHPRLLESNDRFDFSILGVKEIHPEKEFEIRVFTSPKIKSADTIIKQRGHSNYRVILKWVGDVPTIETVEHISTEI